MLQQLCNTKLVIEASRQHCDYRNEGGFIGAIFIPPLFLRKKTQTLVSILMEEYIYPNGRFWRSNFQVTTAFSIKGSSSLWKHLPAEHILMQLPKKKKLRGVKSIVGNLRLISAEAKVMVTKWTTCYVPTNNLLLEKYNDKKISEKPCRDEVRPFSPATEASNAWRYI